MKKLIVLAMFIAGAVAVVSYLKRNGSLDLLDMFGVEQPKPKGQDPVDYHD